MAALAGAAIGGTIAAIGTLGATLGAASIQSNTATANNNFNIDFQKSVIDRGEKSFTDIGLPKAYYYGGGSIASPNTLIHLGGSNFYEQSGVNSNLPYIGVSPYMQYNHTGQPKNIGSGTRNLPSTSRQTFVKSTMQGEQGTQLGQSDRVGLGAGRYNAAPPPAGMYNSRGVQAVQFSSEQGTQSSIRVNNSTTMTSGLTSEHGIQSTVPMRNIGTGPDPKMTRNFGIQATDGPPKGLDEALARDAARAQTGWFLRR